MSLPPRSRTTVGGDIGYYVDVSCVLGGKLVHFEAPHARGYAGITVHISDVPAIINFLDRAVTAAKECHDG